jgi:hypothetical protein
MLKAGPISTGSRLQMRCGGTGWGTKPSVTGRLSALEIRSPLSDVTVCSARSGSGLFARLKPAINPRQRINRRRSDKQTSGAAHGSPSHTGSLGTVDRRLTKQTVAPLRNVGHAQSAGILATEGASVASLYAALLPQHEFQGLPASNRDAWPSRVALLVFRRSKHLNHHAAGARMGRAAAAPGRTLLATASSPMRACPRQRRRRSPGAARPSTWVRGEPLLSPREGIRAESARRPGKRGRPARRAVSLAPAGVRRP